jgi:hypothetical protein
LLKEFLEREAEPITKGMITKEVVGYKMTMTQANSLYKRLREREQDVRGFIKDAKSVLIHWVELWIRLKTFSRSCSNPKETALLKSLKLNPRPKTNRGQGVV